YMNEEAYKITLEKKLVTFWSRSRNELWTKGETSGNFLELVDISVDCDDDTLLVQVNPVGPVCHTGTDTCWGKENTSTPLSTSKGKADDFSFLSHLEDVIQDRRENLDDKSYVASLFKKGMNKIAQKVGEEGVEVVIEAMDNNDDLFLNESADLIFHHLILLQAKGYKLKDVVEVLKGREK
ncbi:MAG: bifunctional phosphoribosyl-AMP cyclohydrolase/phosphoribosyl-ATP diphosphatase HisIE, partial [Flavobacteriales bacterium]|nr:bifunctional phosphoribosyl-AMP cyclohydrolase/phosphoribosyl-ATP diphosphatase HisIE [Flavobacteriales bacterium]